MPRTIGLQRSLTSNAVIDDKLPVSSKTGQAMCATVKDRTQIWPALVEKAVRMLMEAMAPVCLTMRSTVSQTHGWI